MLAIYIAAAWRNLLFPVESHGFLSEQGFVAQACSLQSHEGDSANKDFYQQGKGLSCLVPHWYNSLLWLRRRRAHKEVNK
jgi:hypothetical protein